MAQSNAITGQGTIFIRNSEEISEINSIEGPGKSRETIDVTKLEDEDGYRQYIGGLREPGTVTLNMNFTRTGFDLFNEDFESDDIQDYEIQFPDDENTTFVFSGLVTELPVSVPIGDKITMDVTIQISGKVNTEGSSS
ncbi:MAG: phage tail tube protein [Bacteroidales bacterium]